MSLKCGYIAIVGRPNVGKSTLLNTMLGQKVSITSRKPQTTRHQLLGIRTTQTTQFLYVDTPGIHSNEPRAINRYMNRTARSVIRDVDVIIFVVDRTSFGEDDRFVADTIRDARAKVIVAINKIDLLANKRLLLPAIDSVREWMPEAEFIPISSVTGENIENLEALVEAELPASPFYFPEDQLTDRSERFLVSEVIREKLMRQLGDELPYDLTIQIDRFERRNHVVHIDATIFVERGGQKVILIGRNGEKLKRIGRDARQDLERMLERKVMLTTWVKVKTGWSNDERALKSLGYDDV